jgi:glutamate/tyrosine decarboxylase-like PLP-dependent enzyme
MGESERTAAERNEIVLPYPAAAWPCLWKTCGFFGFDADEAKTKARRSTISPPAAIRRASECGLEMDED